MNSPLHPAIRVSPRRTTEFMAACAFAWMAGIALTIYFTVSMCCDMKMPGGWTMSMMWMRMPGDTWMTAFLSFTLMWLAMMVAMMMPFALGIFLKTGRSGTSLFFTAAGYFMVWTLPAIILYPLGMYLADAAMQSEKLSRATPLLLGIGLILAGTWQFTPLKINYLLSCRSRPGCTISNTGTQATGFCLGCKEGAICCVCCAGLMTAQLMVGIMNPLAMIMIAGAIATEKLLPRPALVARLLGTGLIVAGVFISVQALKAQGF